MVICLEITLEIRTRDTVHGETLYMGRHCTWGDTVHGETLYMGIINRFGLLLAPWDANRFLAFSRICTDQRRMVWYGAEKTGRISDTERHPDWVAGGPTPRIWLNDGPASAIVAWSQTKLPWCFLSTWLADAVAVPLYRLGCLPQIRQVPPRRRAVATPLTIAPVIATEHRLQAYNIAPYQPVWVDAFREQEPLIKLMYSPLKSPGSINDDGSTDSG